MAKKLIVLSDGTGNSAAKLFKTNVWKLYEALDLSPSSDQIAIIGGPTCVCTTGATK